MKPSVNLRPLVRALADRAEFNKNKAYAILGAHPGPGIDLVIHPVEPLCGKWFVTGKTKAGAAFVRQWWSAQPMSNQHLAEMRKQANNWNLTYTTKLSYTPLEPMVDPE
jgi:hypothetical protein